MPRRSPSPDSRQRDAERTKRRLIDAAFDEFSARGLAGARVSDIAARAGVNKQLITYYFGGKAGLYRALRESWKEWEDDVAGPDVPLPEVLTRYAAHSLEDPRGARLLLWQGLTEAGTGQRPGGETEAGPATAPTTGPVAGSGTGSVEGPDADSTTALVLPAPTTPAARTTGIAPGLQADLESDFTADAARMRARQVAGEFPADLHPGVLQLAMMAMSVAPVALPTAVKVLTGLDAGSSEFAELYIDQVRRIVERITTHPDRPNPA